MTDNKKNFLESDYIRGKWLSDPPKGEEIIISGISGSYANAENVHELRDALFDKIDLTSETEKRFPMSHSDIPKRIGMLKNIDKFDAGFFGVHYIQSHTMNSTLRILLEKTMEALFDAGLHPSDLEGSRTGVFLANADYSCIVDNLEYQQYLLTGQMRSIMANRISYFLKLNGPSYTLDSGSNSCLVALEQAFIEMRKGSCDSAIIGGTQINLDVLSILGFARLGVLSPEGRCYPFDARGKGFVRADCVGAIILQKANRVKRYYAQIIHVKSNSDGFKEKGFLHPSRKQQGILLKEFYEECGVDVSKITYLETHGTGTQAGDPEEEASVDHVIGKNRNRPLLVGTVKSSTGHSEASAAIISISKCIIAFESGCIPPTVNFNTPRLGLKGIEENRIQMVKEKCKIEDKEAIIAINGFGMGGVNSHLALRWNLKEKKNQGIPDDDLPRLVCVSGRTEEAITTLLNDFNSRSLDAEHASLLHEIYRKDIPNHHYRGFSITSKNEKAVSFNKYFSGIKYPLLLVLGDFGNTWKDVAKQLLAIPKFLECFKKINVLLIVKNIELLKIIQNDDSLNEEIVNFLGGLAVHIGIIDVLKHLGIPTELIFGSTFGELVCLFFYGSQSLEKTIDLAYNSATHFIEKKVPIINEHSTQCETLNDHIKCSKSFRKEFASKASFHYFFENMTSESFVLEIGSENFFSLSDVGKQKKIRFFSEKSNNYFTGFLETLGRLYEYGYNPQIILLYPKIKYPVSRGTPMVAPHIKWDHSNSWVCSYENKSNLTNFTTISRSISIASDEWKFVKDHIIDGRNLFPASGYLYVVWEVLTLSLGRHLIDSPIVFENCQFVKATLISSKTVEFTIRIEKLTGNFVILHDDSIVMYGKISILNDKFDGFSALPQSMDYATQKNIFMNSEDVHKELQLRGYDYRNQFQNIEKYNINAKEAFIKWKENWVTFIDNMMQLKLLELSSRLLYIPYIIKNLIIHPKYHKSFVENFSNFPSLPVRTFNNNIIRCGGIQITGIVLSAVSRKKNSTQPALEKYQFVSNETELTILESIRVNLQLALENNYNINPKIVEIVYESDVSENYLFMTPLMQESIESIPGIQAELIVFSKKQINLPNFQVKNTDLEENANCFLIAGMAFFKRKEVLKMARKALKNQECYLLTRESLNFCPNQSDTLDLDILTIHNVGNEKIILARSKFNLPSPTVVKISNVDDSFNWIEKVKYSIKSDSNVILYSQNDVSNGLQGLINSLRKEPGGLKVRTVILNDDQAPCWDINNPFYQKQLKKKLALNVYQNSQWGTYRYLPLKINNEVQKKNCYVQLMLRGILSSLQWVEGPFTLDTSQEIEERLVHVYYSAINFQDILIATGRLIPRSNMKLFNKKQISIGMEFSGKDENGRRVAGIVKGNGIATIVHVDKLMLWNVPDKWSLEDAATVVSAYATVLYALIIKGKIKKEDSILIHSGCSEIGLAAIKVALSYGCTIYTTVETNEKRTFLEEKFRQLSENHIGYLKNTSFETFIKKSTNNSGVDLVLSSLSYEYLEASVRCLALGGRFLELGKVDLMNNCPLQLEFLKKEASFHGIILDEMFEGTPTKKKVLYNLVQDAINAGLVEPLHRTVFEKEKIKEACSYMTPETHIGKVLLQIRKEEYDKIVIPSVDTFECLPRYTCNKEKSYVILGGLGGFGLELADWLVKRGAKYLVLSSRTGIKTGYQEYRVSSWKSSGANVLISTADTTKKTGCEQLIREATDLGLIDAIFNLALVMRDALFENQTIDNFQNSFRPKARAICYMDKLSRIMCPDLRDFVVFSSATSGLGNAGQTNYGMANSAMERICEERKLAGLPATAIQWGPIGDVGLFAETQKKNNKIGLFGTIPQSIFSCFKVMDTLLTQKSATIVSSIVLAEKNIKDKKMDSLVDVILNILGFKKELISSNTKLSEMGMDSLSLLEIRQAMERDFSLYLTPEEIRNLTFKK